jgi:glycosyltransferase involved in cell wall biosynthesis
VDRHSNFIFSKRDALNYSKWSIFVSNLLSNYSIKNADMTIVTNEYLKHLIEKKGGRAFVLQDKLPEFFNRKIVPLKGKYNVIFVCTFSPDEPVDEVIKAADYFPNDICIYITGPYHKYNKLSRTIIPSNVILTGFLEEEDYQSLLQSGTLLLTLTDRDHTLLCSAYESVAVGKPFIMSKKNDLREYFYKGNATTENFAKDIAKAVNIVLERYNVFTKEIEELKLELQNAWEKRFAEFKNILENMETCRKKSARMSQSSKNGCF